MITISVFGDFCPQKRVRTLFDASDFSAVLGETRLNCQNSDLSIVNLECPVCQGTEQPISKEGPNLSCSPKGVEALRWAGIGCVTLANNHFLDYGEDGVKSTIYACNINGIDVVGGGLNLSDASQIQYKKINGEKIAIINCCEHEFSIATNNSAGSNPLNPIRQYYSIKDARKNADYVLVIVHGGHEHFQLPSLRMQDNYRFFIDAGADAVVNHHQHCISGYEVYKGKPIFYGLGNFCFDWQNNEKWCTGLMVRIVFSDKISFKLYPFRQCADAPTIKFFKYDEIDETISNLNSIICNPERLSKENDDFFLSSNSLIAFEPFYSSILTKIQYRGLFPSLLKKKQLIKILNVIDCESHRDKIVFSLKNKLR